MNLTNVLVHFIKKKNSKIWSLRDNKFVEAGLESFMGIKTEKMGLDYSLSKYIIISLVFTLILAWL